MKYTIKQLPENYFAVCVGDKKLTLPLSEADARRVAAALNACDGFSTEALELGDISAALDAVCSENAKLSAQIKSKDYAQKFHSWLYSVGTMTPLDKLRQLLATNEASYAKVKGLNGSRPAYMKGYTDALREAVAILEAETVGRSALFNNQKS